MLLWLVYKLYSVVEFAAWSAFRNLLYVCFTIAIAHNFGWVERLIWWIVEKEATKLLNGTQVTIGSFRIDWSKILQGGRITFDVSNVVLHTPQRDVWGWESPLIARVGQASVEVNAPITIFHEVVLRTKLPIEVYSLVVADVQVFLERHEQVFNVYLCDIAAVLPPPPYLPSRGASQSIEGTTAFPPAECTISDQNTRVDQQQRHKEQAQKLVHDMIQAVQSLGRAAQRGSLHTAVKQHGVEIAEKVRNGLSTRNRDTMRLEQGVAVMEQVGKVAVESLKAPKLILPERRVGDGPKPPLARVGRIFLKDLRIFTKDSWIQINAGSNAMSTAGDSSTSIASNSGDTVASSKQKGNWNRPIFIESLTVRAAELCPPMSLKDEDDLPAVYQTVDKIIEIVWRRLLTEMAKSNTGRLFSTAIGEVLSFMQHTGSSTGASSVGGKPIPTTTPLSTSTAILKSTENTDGTKKKSLTTSQSTGRLKTIKRKHSPTLAEQSAPVAAKESNEIRV